jgi:hypothetical protein
LTPSAIVLYFLGSLNKKYHRQFFFLTIVSLLPLLSQAAIAKVYTSRYILYATTPLVPIFALGLFWLLTRKGLLLKLSSITLLLIPIIVSAIYVIKPDQAPMSFDMRNGYLEEWTAGVGNKEVANYLIDLESKGDRVVVFTEGYFGTMPDGLQIYVEGHPNITIVGSPPDVSRIPDGLLNSAKTNKNFLVVNKSRNRMSASDLQKLTLVQEFPKAVRIDGTREILQFFALK